MDKFRVVPDSLRNRDPVARGRKPHSLVSLALLGGQTIFLYAKKGKTWGSLYRLAKKHKMQARVRWTTINREEGYVIWFENENDTQNEEI